MVENEKTKRSEDKKPNRSTSYFVNFLLFVLVAVMLFNCLSMFKKISDKKKKYNELKSQYDQALILKNEYEYLLNEDNQLEYIERIAREKYGYVAPGERAFYDSSLGK